MKSDDWAVWGLDQGPIQPLLLFFFCYCISWLVGILLALHRLQILVSSIYIQMHLWNILIQTVSPSCVYCRIDHT